MNKPLHLEQLTRTNHEDAYVLYNRLADVINALSDRLFIVESALSNGVKPADPRQTHVTDPRYAQPL